MGNLGDFDATQVEPSQSGDFSPIPAGDYVAMIIASQFKKTRAGTGEYLELTLEILDGKHKGRRLWDRLNLKNPSPDAVAIAKKTLSAICHATGKLRPGDTANLHNIPMIIKVTLEPRKDSPGEFSNNVKGYKSASGGAPAYAPAPAQQAAVAPQSEPAPPWQQPQAQQQAAPAQQQTSQDLPPWKRTA